MARLPSLKAVHYFAVAAGRGSFTAAAEELNVTQGAVSRMVQALEQDLDVPLFDRKGRFLSLTPAGQRYYEEVNAALAAIAMASSNLRARVSEDSLSVVVNSGFASRWLIPRLASFNRANPGLRIDIVPTEHEVRGVNPAHFVAIRHGLGDWSGHEAIDLGIGGRLAVVCAPALNARLGPVATAAELATRPLLTYSAVARDPWIEFLSHHGLPADILARATHYYQLPLLAEAAIAGYGYGLLPLCLIEKELKSGDLMIVKGTEFDSDRRYFLTYLRQSDPSPRIRRFESWLLREARGAVR